MDRLRRFSGLGIAALAEKATLRAFEIRRFFFLSLLLRPLLLLGPFLTFLLLHPLALLEDKYYVDGDEEEGD